MKTQKFFFSQLTRVRKFLPKKHLQHLEERKQKNNTKKYYEGFHDSEQSELKKEKPQHFYPIQHPKMLSNTDTSIISYSPPVQNLTPYNRIPPEVMLFNAPEFESPSDSKSLDIGILGPPNAGKSSLINKLTGSQISAVSSKYNTTYDKVEGVYTDVDERIQLVLYDTPGAVKVSKSILSKRIITRAWNVIPDCDRVSLIVFKISCFL